MDLASTSSPAACVSTSFYFFFFFLYRILCCVPAATWCGCGARDAWQAGPAAAPAVDPRRECNIKINVGGEASPGRHAAPPARWRRTPRPAAAPHAGAGTGCRRVAAARARQAAQPPRPRGPAPCKDASTGANNSSCGVSLESQRARRWRGAERRDVTTISQPARPARPLAPSGTQKSCLAKWRVQASAGPFTYTRARPPRLHGQDAGVGWARREVGHRAADSRAAADVFIPAAAALPRPCPGRRRPTRPQ